MITPVLSKPSPRSCARWKWFVPLLPLLTLTSCLVIVSTSPTTISGATIVFVATDHHGFPVPSMHVTVIDVAGAWRLNGVTAGDGSFRCGVRSGVARVRAEVVPPAGYVLLTSEPWPRHLDVPSSGSVRVEIRVRAR
jgi:hypothetical protein